MNHDCTHCEARILFQSDVVELKTNYQWLREAIEAIQESTKKIAACSEAMVKLEAEGNETREALRRCFRAVEKETAAREGADAALEQAIKEGCRDITIRLAKIEEDMPSLRLTKTIVFSLIGIALTNIGGVIWLLMHLQKLIGD